MKLPAFLLRDLYEKVLVNFPSENIKKTENEIKKTDISNEDKQLITKTNLKYLGGNQKNILILVKQQDVVYLNEEDLSFLTNILIACKLKLSDIALINIASNPINYANLQVDLEPVTMLLFGLSPSEIKLPFEIPVFQIKKHGKCTIMTAPSLAVLNAQNEESKVLKLKLWATLKTLFITK